MNDFIYPPSPESVPSSLKSITSRYKMKVSMAVLSILLFFALYISLIAGTLYLIFLTLIAPIEITGLWSLLLRIGITLGAVMLFVFTVKFLFKIKKVKVTNRRQIKKNENPKLWKFIYKICEETGAPKPKRIFIDPDVNAYVAYKNIWLSLIFPIGKDLTLGSALIDGLNLSEFKAVVSHEFGHFSQRSMKVGSYIMSVNTIIFDMIFNRDKWDDILQQWRSQDLRLSAAAWAISPLIWLIRQLLNLFYQLLNIVYSSLSREMEFNADKVAVSTSGSEAIVSSLWKLDPSFNLWNQCLNHAFVASNKQVYSENLYHDNKVIHSNYWENVKQNFSLLQKDHLGGKKYFNTDEQSKTSMYASHPSNHDRELNAKQPFIKAVNDDSSPWLLFDDAEQLQKEMTALIYDQYLSIKEPKLNNEISFAQFVEEEVKANALLEAYDNTFEQRYLNVPTSDELGSCSISESQMSKEIANLKEELKELMKPLNDLNKSMLEVQAIAEGTSTSKNFVHKEKTYAKKQLNEAFKLLWEEREALYKDHFTDWDKRFCCLYYKLAENKGAGKQLLSLYRQHEQLSVFYKMVTESKNQIMSRLEYLQNTEVDESMIREFEIMVNNTVENVNKELDEFTEFKFSPLPNIESAEELKSALVKEAKLKRVNHPMFDNDDFNRFIMDTDLILANCQRVDQKSIGEILMQHAGLEKTLETDKSK